jgi:LPXTG-motif cell wall-anchored protein
VQSDVLGSQEEQSPAATIPRTGADVGGYLLLAGLALVLGGLAVRFGQVEEPALG